MPKIDWLWLLVGIAVGLIVHKLASHPNSPINSVSSKFA